MRIGFDIDGVLTDIEKFQLKYGKDFFKKKYNKEVYDENGYGIREVFNCDSSKEVAFWLKYNMKYSTTIEPRIGVASTLRKLHEEGHQIYIISSRVMTTQNNVLGKFMRNLVYNWLKKNDIYYDEIEFCSVENSHMDKLKVCEKHNIDIMIEDKVNNIEFLSKKIPTLCFTTRNNKEAQFNSNVYRVNSFDDVYSKINSIINKSSFKLLSLEQRQLLSKSELLDYYQNLKQYYLNLPYDIQSSKTADKQCLKLLNVLQPIFNKFYNPITIGCSIPLNSGTQGYIFAGNHLHSFDPLMFTSNQINSFKLLAKEELKDQKIGKLFEYIGSIFTDNSDDLSKAISKSECIKSLLHGYNIMLFPEGTRNKTEKYMLDFKYGTVAIAQTTGSPIIPFAVNDEYRLKEDSLIINIGSPIYVSPDDDLTVINEKLRDTIASLLWEIMEYNYEEKHKVKTNKKI